MQGGVHTAPLEPTGCGTTDGDGGGRVGELLKGEREVVRKKSWGRMEDWK
jgi:hypothetical protein